MMTNMVMVRDFTNSPRAISATDGEKVFQQVISFFQNEEPVTLDFQGIDLTITAFLNSCIGKLYGIYSPEKVRGLLTIKNFNNDEKPLLKLVIDKAKERFGNHSDENIDLLDEG